MPRGIRPLIGGHVSVERTDDEMVLKLIERSRLLIALSE